MARTAHLTASLFVSLTATCALAQPVFSTGAADTLNGSGREMSAWIQADDFMLSGDTALTGASMQWFTTNRLASWDRSINWFVFEDLAGAPGPLLASGSAVNVLTDSEGRTNYDRYSTSFDFDTSVGVEGGTRYWFGLHMAADFGSNDHLYWADSTTSTFNATYESLGGSMNNWVDVSGSDRAFALVPSPGLVPMLTLAGIVLIRRRR